MTWEHFLNVDLSLRWCLMQMPSSDRQIEFELVLDLIFMLQVVCFFAEHGRSAPQAKEDPLEMPQVDSLQT